MHSEETLLWPQHQGHGASNSKIAIRCTCGINLKFLHCLVFKLPNSQTLVSMLPCCLPGGVGRGVKSYSFGWLRHGCNQTHLITEAKQPLWLLCNCYLLETNLCANKTSVTVSLVCMQMTLSWLDSWYYEMPECLSDYWMSLKNLDELCPFFYRSKWK